MSSDNNLPTVDFLSKSSQTFRQIFDYEWDRCVRVASAMLWPDREAARDVVQESFFKLWKNRDKIDPNRGYRDWLYRSIRNQAIDYMRKKRPTSYDPTDFAEPPIHDDHSHEENAEIVVQALGALSEKHRQVVLLRFWEGFSIEEIARALEIPPGTVGSRLANAIPKLRAVLKDIDQC